MLSTCYGNCWLSTGIACEGRDDGEDGALHRNALLGIERSINLILRRVLHYIETRKKQFPLDPSLNARLS